MQKKIKSLSLLLLCSVVLFGQATSVKNRIKSVENGLIPYVPVQGFPAWNIYERMKHYKVPGVSIAVVNNFKVEWAKGYGLADTLKKTPITPQTMFSAGSISKLVMAAAAFQLIQEQKISLDEPINQYLKSWKIAENDYTRNRRLCLHAGGIIILKCRIGRRRFGRMNGRISWIRVMRGGEGFGGGEVDGFDGIGIFNFRHCGGRNCLFNSRTTGARISTTKLFLT